MLGALLALAAAAVAQDVPRPTRLRIYEVRTALRFDEGELQRVNFRYDRSSGIKSDIARSLVDVGLTTDRGFVFEVGRKLRDFFTDDPESGGRHPLPRAGAVAAIALAFSFRPLLPQALSRRYSPRRAFPFQRGEPCARVFLFQPLLPTTRYNHSPSCKISSEALDLVDPTAC